ncbi:MAG: hypothetical protein JSR36_05360 [Proteobacteria bacterium]|nr:hypothetical protein [Pseudomonadota bacterium]
MLVVLAIPVLMILGILVFAAVVPPETQEEAAARASRESVAKERTKQQCAIKRICKQYGEARQQCAVAGDFANCIRVKTGMEQADLANECTEDGRVQGLDPSAEPSGVDCFLN